MHKVLVAEDDDSVWFVLEWMMESVPCSPERVTSGKEALERLQTGEFDAAVLDLMLPEMHGDEVMAQLDTDPRFKGFPVLVDSSIAGGKWKRDIIKSFKNLRVEMSVRPADPTAIIGTMRRLLGLPVQDSDAGTRPVEKKKVLIVDDDEAVRLMYVPYFEGKGYKATPAANGKEALECLENEPADLVILDLNMPEMPGEEVMAAMAAHPKWKNIPIIIDSALPASSQRVQSIKSTFTEKLRFDFFQRPSSLHEIADAIGRILII